MDNLRERIVTLYTTPLADGRMYSLEDVARIVERHPATVGWHLKQAGVPRRPKGTRALFPHQYAEIVRQYTTPLPDGTWKGSKMIAAEFGVSDVLVQNVLRRMGVTLRTAKEAHAHGKRCGPIKHTEQFGEAPLCACGCGQPVTWHKNRCRWYRFAPGHYRKDEPYKSAEWLREQYEVRGRTAEDIATECGVNQTAVIRWMNVHGIPRRHISVALKGKQAGAKNPAWKGGTTPERQRLHKQGGWREFALSIYRRDNFTCRRCSAAVSARKGVAAHHVRSWAGAPELRFDPANVVTLCKPCHLWVHSSQNVAREWLG